MSRSSNRCKGAGYRHHPSRWLGLSDVNGGQGRDLHPSFSPAGWMIVFASSRSGQEKLYVLAANGDRRQPLSPLLWFSPGRLGAKKCRP
jgi:hypothetical protein